MESLRKLIEYKISENGVRTIHVDETKIDLNDTYDELIPHWEPDTKLPDWEDVSVVYLDIETYSDNKIVLDSIRYRIEFGRLHKYDKPFFEFLLRESLIDDELHKYCLGRIESGELGVFSSSNPDSIDAHYDIMDTLDDPTNREFIINYVAGTPSGDIVDKAALHGDLGKIVLIGVMNEKGGKLIFDCLEQGERVCLMKFFKLIEVKKPKILAHYNGFNFDMPFIKRRCELLNMTYPYYVCPYPTTHSTAQMNSRPQTYYSHWINRGETAVADLYHLVLQWHFTSRKLTAYSLKQATLQIGLRSEARTELSYKQMKDCVKNGNMPLLKEYLGYDLEDSKLLGDFLLPDTYYQLEINTDWKLHKLFYAGMGSKWNTKIIQEYEKLGIYEIPEADEQIQFQGGLTLGKAGYHKYVGKCDIGSQYPHAMLLYGICSKKDTHKLMLKILNYQLKKRLKLKAFANAKANKGTAEGNKAKQRQGSLKIYINSGYGALGTGGIAYNDYEAAALVTAIGRAILRKMMWVVEKHGGKVVSVDTDGVFFSGDSLEHCKEIASKINAHMPKNHSFSVLAEHEVEANALYVPPKGNGSKEGLKKNYIYITADNKLKFNGKFTKKDVPIFLRELTPNIVKKYHDEGLEGVKKYRKKVIYDLLNNNIDTSLLSVTRLIKANEKTLVECGVGQRGEVKTFWRAQDKQFYGKKGQLLKKTEKRYTINNDEINWLYYKEEVDKQFDEFISFVVE